MERVKTPDGFETLRAEYDMLPQGGLVLCAVSGGADSMYLLSRLLELREASFCRVAAAHFNHQLRGEESDRDEAFVREFCARRNVPLAVGHGEVRLFARQEKYSVEEAARILRYDFLEHTAADMGADVIATAHTADDNAETVLLSLIRGCGLRGLCGIPPRRGKIVRPMLDVTRAQVERYLAEHDVPHMEDSTNTDETYTRNRVRRQVLPLLRELNPKAAEHIAQTAAQLSEIDRYLDENARSFLSQAQESPSRVSFPLEAFSRAPKVLRPRMVFQLLDRLKVGRKDIRAVHLEAILSLSPGGSLDLPHGLTAQREYDTLILTTQLPASPLEPMALSEGDNPIPGTDWTVSLSGPPWAGLVVRARQTGDELALTGRPRRSLKKLFIDEKIPRWERERIPVAADGDGVVAVAGFGPNTAHPRHGELEVVFSKTEKEKG